MKEIKFHGDKLVIGRGSIDYLLKLDIKKAFIVTGGSSMFNNGTIERIKKILCSIGASVFIYSGIQKNPTKEDILIGTKKMAEFDPDSIIAVGGGSAIDAAKAMTLFYEYKDLDFEKMVKGDIPSKRHKTLFVAIPSTSGTGTEVTRVSVITFNELDLKIGFKTDAFIPDVAILDSDITMTMPKNITAETGMDAMTHAVECYINKNIDDFTGCLAEGAVGGLFKYLPSSYENEDEVSREKVHNYQCIAGCAFGNVGLGMAHGISHAFGAKFNLGHGLLNAVALPYVLKFNSRDIEVKRRLDYLAKLIDSKDFIESIKLLNKKLNIPSSYKELGISESLFEENYNSLAENSLKGATRVNPIVVSRKNIDEILRNLYYGE